MGECSIPRKTVFLLRRSSEYPRSNIVSEDCKSFSEVFITIAELFRFQLTRAIQADPRHALIEVCIHVTASCNVADILGVLDLVTPTYLHEAGWMCHRVAQVARLFRITSHPWAASGSLMIGAIPRVLELRVREGILVTFEDNYFYDDSLPAQPQADTDTFVANYIATPFLQ